MPKLFLSLEMQYFILHAFLSKKKDLFYPVCLYVLETNKYLITCKLCEPGPGTLLDKC